MEDKTQTKILHLLDIISLELAATRNEFRGEVSGLRGEVSGLRVEMHAGFGRVERRLGNLENRVEGIETRVGGVEIQMRSFRGEFDRRLTALEG